MFLPKALLAAAKKLSELDPSAKTGNSQMPEQTHHQKGLSNLERVIVEIAPMTVRTVLNGPMCAFCMNLVAFLRLILCRLGNLISRRVVS